ncbi:MAG: prolipoprotein diacylglyceryl transferase [Oscillospiraceae bacterium]|nr:prolipoprotein diacylglyceryl transferase [Oscillospiraceae bacterium]
MEFASQLMFPGLSDSVLHLKREAFTLFGLDIYWYGVLIATGFMLALLYTFARCKDTFGLNVDRVIDVIICGTIGGILSARLYYVAFRWDYYGKHLDQLLDTRSGGLAIYGGIIGGFLFGCIAAYIRKVKVLPMADMAASGFLIGQAVGRWGNFVNIEAFGSITDKPWGMASPEVFAFLRSNMQHLKETGVDIVMQLEAMGRNVDFSDPSMWKLVTVHPTFFYESMWCLVGFIALAWYTNRRKFDGELTLMYAAWYGLGRFWIEGLRTDSLLIPSTSFRVSQLVAAVLAVSASVTLAVIYNKLKKSPESLPPLYATTQESRDAREPEGKK